MIVVSFRRLTPSFQSATAHQETKSRLTSREVVYELETGLLADAAAYGEHSADQQSSRNGSLERLWETRAGAVNVKIPKLRSGSYSPPLLELRRTNERARVDGELHQRLRSPPTESSGRPSLYRRRTDAGQRQIQPESGDLLLRMAVAATFIQRSLNRLGCSKLTEIRGTVSLRLDPSAELPKNEDW